MKTPLTPLAGQTLAMALLGIDAGVAVGAYVAVAELTLGVGLVIGAVVEGVVYVGSKLLCSQEY